MYFDPEPKSKREDLWGMDLQLQELTQALKDPEIRLIVIKGLRRTGKTSLLKVALNLVKMPHMLIDVRKTPFKDKKNFESYLISLFQSRLKVKIKIPYAEFELKESNLDQMLTKLNESLKRKKKYMILAFDEAQLLKQIHFDYWLAAIFDNFKHIKVVLTGSEIGVLDRLLGKKVPNAPLAGRAFKEIELNKLTKEESLAFLEAGFKQINKQISKERLIQVVKELDGVIGWLTLYGWLESKNESNALIKAKEQALQVLKDEWNSFLAARRAAFKYKQILKLIAFGINNWKQIKQVLTKKGIKLSDPQLSLYLNELESYGWIEYKEDRGWFLTDPVAAML